MLGRLRRRIFPPVQVARCADCALLIRERRRRPCPICRSTARIVGLGMGDGIHVSDKV